MGAAGWPGLRSQPMFDTPPNYDGMALGQRLLAPYRSPYTLPLPHCRPQANGVGTHAPAQGTRDPSLPPLGKGWMGWEDEMR